MSGTCLRLPHGDRRRVTAIAKTCYDTTNDEVFQSKRRGLQSSSNNHDGSTEEDHAPTAERVTNEDGDDGTDEASQIVRCDSDALVRRAVGRIRGIGSGIWVDNGELVEEDGQRQDASHDTLICAVSAHVKCDAGTLAIWTYRNRTGENHSQQWCQWPS